MRQQPLEFPEKNLFILLGDQRLGPLTLQDIHARFASGEISRGTFLWYPGLLNWVTVGDVPGLDRRNEPEPSSDLKKARKSQVWVYDRGKVVAIEVEELRRQIRDNQFRRADMVYSDSTSKWVRADQHADFASLFRPAVPPPTVESATGQVASAIGFQPKAAIPDPAKTWVYQGVGLAGFVLLAFYAFLAGRPVREIASVQSAEVHSSRLNAVFEIGAPLSALQKREEFAQCRPMNGDAQSATYFQCSGFSSGIGVIEFAMTQGRVSRLGLQFKSDTQAKALFAKMRTDFGKPLTTSSVSCTALNQDQRVRYAVACKENAIALWLWNDGVNDAVALVRVKGSDATPLEISFTKLPQAR